MYVSEYEVSKPKFPSPFIKYKIIPWWEEKKGLDVCSTDNPKKKLKKNNLIIWDYHGGPNQLWHFVEKGQGQFIIVNISRGFVVKLSDSVDKDAPLVANPYLGNPNELWTLQPVVGGGFEIVSVVNNKALDLYH